MGGAGGIECPPCTPVSGAQHQGLIEDETLADLGAIVTVDHPERGSFKTVALRCGCRLTGRHRPVAVAREHTDEICTELDTRLSNELCGLPEQSEHVSGPTSKGRNHYAETARQHRWCWKVARQRGESSCPRPEAKTNGTHARASTCVVRSLPGAVSRAAAGASCVCRENLTRRRRSASL